MNILKIIEEGIGKVGYDLPYILKVVGEFDGDPFYRYIEVLLVSKKSKEWAKRRAIVSELKSRNDRIKKMNEKYRRNDPLIPINGLTISKIINDVDVYDVSEKQNWNDNDFHFIKYSKKRK